jgi:hypothetical protein
MKDLIVLCVSEAFAFMLLVTSLIFYCGSSQSSSKPDYPGTSKTDRVEESYLVQSDSTDFSDIEAPPIKKTHSFEMLPLSSIIHGK